MVYQTLAWVLQNLEMLKTRAYLGRYEKCLHTISSMFLCVPARLIFLDRSLFIMLNLTIDYQTVAVLLYCSMYTGAQVYILGQPTACI